MWLEYNFFCSITPNQIPIFSIPFSFHTPCFDFLSFDVPSFQVQFILLPLIFTILSFLQQHIKFLSVGRTVCLTLIHFFSYSFIHSFLTVLDNLLILLSKVYLINFLFINSSIYNIFKVNCFDLWFLCFNLFFVHVIRIE